MLEFNIEQPFAQDAEEVVIGSCLLPEGDDTFDLVHRLIQLPAELDDILK